MSRRGGKGGGKGGGGRFAGAAGRAAQGGGRVVTIPPQPPTNAAPDGDWFGPGNPLPGMAPRSVAGRRYDYAFAANMQITPRVDTPVSFADLRFLADRHDLTRLAIETRKDQMSRQRWTFGIVDSEDDLSPDQQARADRYRKIFRRPDGENFWADWLRMLLEDMLVIDAPSIFIRRTIDGEEVVGLYQVDGATIKPVIDAGGRTPEPPEAAYQQVLHGMPAVNYTSRQLCYRPRNRRVHTVWGYSPVEQIIATVNIALRRQLWQHAYFTNGNIPDSLIGVPAAWSPDQIRDFQDWFDGMLLGDSSRRRGAIFVPGEVAKSYVPTKEAEIFGTAEEWLARVVCFAFSIPHQALVKEVNRATAQSSQEQAIDDGLSPVMNWVKSLIDGILIDHFGEAELEFRWIDDKEMDPKVQDEIWKARVDNGTATRNEHRVAVGMDARAEPEADMLMASALSNPTPLSVEASIEQQRQRQDSGVFPTPPKPGEESAAPGGAGKPNEEPKPADGPANAKVAKAARKGRPADYRKITVTRRAVERQRRKLQASLAKGLTRIGARVAAAVEPLMEKAAKAASDDIDYIIQVALGALGTFDFLINPTAEALEAVAEDAVSAALAILGGETENLFDEVSQAAVAAARERAAELVGRRVLSNGDVIDNPDARWAITESTRDMIRDTITRVLEENEGSRTLVEELQDSYAFSPERAEMISRTEIANANSSAAMSSYRAARDAGVSVKKEWEPGGESCEICLLNADAGPIDLDDQFPSGDDETPAHPNCTCATLPVVEDDATGDDQGGEE